MARWHITTRTGLAGICDDFVTIGLGWLAEITSNTGAVVLQDLVCSRGGPFFAF